MKTKITKQVILLTSLINLIFSIGIIKAQSTTSQSITPCFGNSVECFNISAPSSLRIPTTFINNFQKNLAIGFNTNLGETLEIIDYRLDGGFEVTASVSPFYLASDGNTIYTASTSPIIINFDQIKILSYNEESTETIDGNLPQYLAATSLIKPLANFNYSDYLNATVSDPLLYPGLFTGNVINNISDPLEIVNADVLTASPGRYGDYRIGLGFLIQLPPDSILTPGLVDGNYNFDVTFNLIPKLAI